MSVSLFADIEKRISPNKRGALTDEELWDVMKSVQDSYFLGNEYGRTIDECMTEFYDGNAPDWIAFQTKDRTCYVNCCGVSEIDGDEVEVALQFMMDEDLRSFSLVAMTVDDEPQSDETMEEFQAAFSRKKRRYQ